MRTSHFLAPPLLRLLGKTGILIFLLRLKPLGSLLNVYLRPRLLVCLFLMLVVVLDVGNWELRVLSTHWLLPTTHILILVSALPTHLAELLLLRVVLRRVRL